MIPNKPVILEKMEFPDPVIEVAVEPKTKIRPGEDGRPGAGASCRRRIPSFRVDQSMTRAARPCSRAWASLHLEILVDRMKREFKVDANVGAPQVAYRETIGQSSAEIDYTHKKQTGGSGQFARVKIMFEPARAGSGFEFESKVVGGSVPKEYMPGVEKGLAPARDSGVIAGFPHDRLQGDADRRRES